MYVRSRPCRTEPLLQLGCPRKTHPPKNSLCACQVAQSCLTLCDSMDCSPPGSSVHGTCQVRILERVAIASSRGSSPCGDQTHVSCASFIGRRFFTAARYGDRALVKEHFVEGGDICTLMTDSCCFMAETNMTL